MRGDLARRLAVYLVADPDQTNRDLVADVEAALAGGVSCVQFRAKHLTDRETIAVGAALKARCAIAGAQFLVNDRLDLALAVGADGVHLGVDDLPVREARRLGGPDLVIGFSPDSDEQTAAAKDDGADYLGVGPVFGSTSKLDAGQAIGPGGIARRARLAGIPIIGIGGVDAESAPRVIAAGAVGVAVISAILGAEDPTRAARALRRAVDSALAAPATRPPVPRLMSITDSTNARRALPDLALRALAGGADAVQVREKHLDQARLLATVRAIVEAVSSPEFVVVNGDLGVALRVGAGLHLPESDEQIEVARDLLGSHVLIGRSVHSERAARASAGADYLIAGHVFPTRSHNDRPPIGIEGLRRIVEAAPCPVLAIGGIDASNVGAAIAAGAHGAAVISAINDAADPDAAARLLRSKIDEALEA